MILGLGNDLVDIRRIERTLGRFGMRFVERVFTEVEREKSERRKNRAASYAKRFAAKEACAKALGTGFRQGVFWRDLGVVNLDSGKPGMALTGGAAQRLASMTPPGMRAMIELTITDESPLAEAVVIISAVPDNMFGNEGKSS
jgi:holo-[acyl-carrier protein] synthase